MTALETAQVAARLLDTKKAEQVRILGIRSLSVICDYFVIATGTGNTHVKALADELEFQLGNQGIKPHHIEGYRSNSWILLDYGEVVVHIFTRESREFYDLDRLWQNGEPIPVEQKTEA